MLLSPLGVGSSWRGGRGLPPQSSCLLGLLEGWAVLGGCWGPSPPCSSPSVRGTRHRQLQIRTQIAADGRGRIQLRLKFVRLVTR